MPGKDEHHAQCLIRELHGPEVTLRNNQLAHRESLPCYPMLLHGSISEVQGS